MAAAADRAVIERFDAILNSQDLSRLGQVCTPDMVNHALAPDRPAGLAGTRAFLATRGRSSAEAMTGRSGQLGEGACAGHNHRCLLNAAARGATRPGCRCWRSTGLPPGQCPWRSHAVPARSRRATPRTGR
jgi:hypothetical protein